MRCPQPALVIRHSKVAPANRNSKLAPVIRYVKVASQNLRPSKLAQIHVTRHSKLESLVCRRKLALVMIGRSTLAPGMRRSQAKVSFWKHRYE
jgi:hypothetical protein